VAHGGISSHALLFFATADEASIRIWLRCVGIARAEAIVRCGIEIVAKIKEQSMKILEHKKPDSVLKPGLS